MRLGYAVFAADEGHHHDSVELCNENYYDHPDWAHNVGGGVIKTKFNKKASVVDSNLNINGSYYIYEGSISYKYPVELTSWYNVAFKICDDGDEAVVARIDGDVTFRNPYGYIPGELWAFLPFEVRAPESYDSGFYNEN
jgi:hypothetical protein